MVKKRGDGEVLRCSFCNKHQDDVRKLIAGPMVFICDECVDVCLDIIADDDQFEAHRRGAEKASVAPEQPAIEHIDMAALMDHVAGLDPCEQWLLVIFLLGHFGHLTRVRALKARHGGEASFWDEPPRLGDDARAAINDRVAALCSSDRWLLVMHLLARLRSCDLVS